MFKDAKIGDSVLVIKSDRSHFKVGSIKKITEFEGVFVVVGKLCDNDNPYHAFYETTGFSCLDDESIKIIPVSPALRIMFGE